MISLVLALSDCDVTPETYKPEPNIYALLSSDSSFARVMVGKTASLRDTIRIDTIIDTIWWDEEIPYVETLYVLPWNGVSDAAVILKKGSQSFTLKEDPDSAGYYYSESMHFSGGETWQLTVNYPKWNEITAQTTFPAEFEITSPLKDTVQYYDTLSWTRPGGAGGYAFALWGWWEEDTSHVDSALFSIWGLLLPAESCYVPVGTLLDRIGIYCDSIVFLVAALDSNAYDYHFYHRDYYYFPFNEDTLDMGDYMHIEGAWGAFGSQTVERSKVFIVRHDTIFSH